MLGGDEPATYRERMAVEGRRTRLKDCTLVAGRQHGVITRTQAMEAGLSRSAIHRLTDDGPWETILPGVYLLARATGVDALWRQKLAALALWIGIGCALSRCAAGALWQLDGIDPGVVEISTTRHIQTARPDFSVHRVRSLPARDVRKLDGLPVTSVARTIVDLAAVLDAASLEVAVESALRRRQTSRNRLKRQIEAMAITSPGRGALMRIIDQGSPAATDSALEVRVWQMLRRARLPLPIRQYRIVDERKRAVARVDFAYPSARLAIEADGYRFHSGRQDLRRNVARYNAMTLLGWVVLRVTWDDVYLPIDDFRRRVEALLARGSGEA